MGNYSTLWIAKNKDQYNQDTDIYQEIKYSIPLFWLALFEEKQIKQVQNEYAETLYYFETTATQAAQLFKNRISLWAKLYQEDKVEILAKEFLKYIEQYPEHSIILKVDDILSMYLDPQSEDAKNEMIDMLQVIEQLNKDPKSKLPFKHWLSSQFEFNSFEKRYLELDGLGEKLLPCPEVDEWLKQIEPTVIQQQSSVEITNLAWSIDEEMFYRLLVTKGEVYPNNLMGYQHRYSFLVKIKDSQKRVTLLKSLLIGEIFYCAFFWLILIIVDVLFSWFLFNQLYLKIVIMIALFGLISWFFWKRISYRIQSLKNLKPIIT